MLDNRAISNWAKLSDQAAADQSAHHLRLLLAHHLQLLLSHHVQLLLAHDPRPLRLLLAHHLRLLLSHLPHDLQL
jgi:hypothetical protein